MDKLVRHPPENQKTSPLQTRIAQTIPQQCFYPKLFISKNYVIPARAGIQIDEKPPRKWANIKVLPAAQNIFYGWIPAFAGMTA